MAGSSMPQPNVDYPVKLGRSLSPSTPPVVRNHFALHVVNMPDTRGGGIITANKDDVSVRLPLDDTDKSVELSGKKRVGTQNAMGEYIFVFHEGTIYVERLNDCFERVRNIGNKEALTTLPSSPEMEIGHDDPWAPGYNPNNTNRSTSPSCPASRRGSPRISQTASKKLSVASPTISKSYIGRTAHKSQTAHKSVATKAIPTVMRNSVSPNNNNGMSSSDDSDSSSDDDDDDDDSGDSSANDSDNFTDNSSDED